MSFARRLVPWSSLVVVGAIAWWSVREPQQAATWIRVEAPEHATAGTPFPVHVTLFPDRSPQTTQPMFIGVHLHGLTSRHQWRGSLTGAPPQLVEASDGVFEFNPVIPEDKTSGFVFLLVYVSPTGRWEDREIAAASHEIPVLAVTDHEATDQLRPLPVYDRGSERSNVRRDATPIRIVLALGWLICGWVLCRPSTGAIPWRYARRILPLSAAIFALWELLPLEGILAERARAFARAHDLYDGRRSFQKPLTVAVAIVMAGLIVAVFQRIRNTGFRLLLVGFTLHVGVTLAGFLSYHRVDAILATNVFSLPLIQIVQLGALLLALIGIVSGWRQHQSRYRTEP